MQDQAKQPRKKANRHKTYNGTGETQTLGPCLQGRRGVKELLEMISPEEHAKEPKTKKKSA